MKVLNQIRTASQDAWARAGVAATLAIASASASAQAVDAFDTVMDNVTTKVESYAGSLVVLAGVAVVFMIGMKYIKKIRGAA